jgi:hypothetical protein
MSLTRRGWNNIIIIGVLCFIAIIKLPDFIRGQFGHEDPSVQHVLNEPTQVSKTVAVLPNSKGISRLVLPHLTLERRNGQWHSDITISMKPKVLITHWQTLQGTLVDEELVAQLSLQLPASHDVDVWRDKNSQPTQLSVYQLPKFWLFHNAQNQWIAVTVAADYIFPQFESATNE